MILTQRVCNATTVYRYRQNRIYVTSVEVTDSQKGGNVVFKETVFTFNLRLYGV